MSTITPRNRKKDPRNGYSKKQKWDIYKWGYLYLRRTCLLQEWKLLIMDLKVGARGRVSMHSQYIYIYIFQKQSRTKKKRTAMTGQCRRHHGWRSYPWGRCRFWGSCSSITSVYYSFIPCSLISRASRARPIMVPGTRYLVGNKSRAEQWAKGDDSTDLSIPPILDMRTACQTRDVTHSTNPLQTAIVSFIYSYVIRCAVFHRQVGIDGSMYLVHITHHRIGDPTRDIGSIAVTWTFLFCCGCSNEVVVTRWLENTTTYGPWKTVYSFCFCLVLLKYNKLKKKLSRDPQGQGNRVALFYILFSFTIIK